MHQRLLYLSCFKRAEKSQDNDRDAFYATYICCLLIEDRASEARLVWHRVPSPQSAELQGIWQVAKAACRNDSPATFAAIKALPVWEPSSVHHLIRTLYSRLQQRTIVDISRSYSSISLNSRAELCDMSLEEAASGLHYIGPIIVF